MYTFCSQLPLTPKSQMIMKKHNLWCRVSNPHVILGISILKTVHCAKIDHFYPRHFICVFFPHANLLCRSYNFFRMMVHL